MYNAKPSSKIVLFIVTYKGKVRENYNQCHVNKFKVHKHNVYKYNEKHVNSIAIDFCEELPRALHSTFFSGSVLSVTDDEEKAKRTTCQIIFSVRHGGANDVRKHFKSDTHIANSKSSSRNQTKLSLFGFGESSAAKKVREKEEQQRLQVQRAGSKFIQFIAEQNLSFRTGDHFTQLVKSMFPDSEIAKNVQCARTKTSVLTRYGNGKYYHDKLIETLRSNPPVYFGLLIDESNDRGVEAKDLVVLLRFFDQVP